jgi:hypothetical protein
MRPTQLRYRKELQVAAVIRIIIQLIADKQEMKCKDLFWCINIKRHMHFKILNYSRK